MIQLDKTENTDTLKQSIAYLEHKGFENIKADIDGYETPKSYAKKGSDIIERQTLPQNALVLNTILK